MKPKKDLFTPCVVRTNGHKQPCSDGVSQCAEDGVIVRSVRKLNTTELSVDEIEELQIKKPQTPHGFDLKVVDSALKTVEEQVQDVELEIEMLSLRKRALKRRLRLLERMSKSLHSSGENQQPA
ncbi:MAG: hypothetical protein NT018_09975 [Armatimonadetes bacterium]|nr:hypothetical protein [Armatimonadota bacterium]